MTDPSSLLPPTGEPGFNLASGLAPETDNAALRALVCGEIRQLGRISFHRFMELVLYHPTEGYYNAPWERIGRGGDYVTSPAVSPLFGYAVACQLAEFWRHLGRPLDFTVLEFGAGTGALAQDILRWVEARETAFFEALIYRPIERSNSLRRRLEAVLAAGSPRARVDIPQAGEAVPTAVSGCVLANELIDSFPVHRVSVRKGQLRELYVSLDGDRLVEIEAEPSTDALQCYFDRIGLLPGEGNIAEVNLEGPQWLAGTASVLQRGYVLVFDYGYAAERLYAPWRRAGTLLCYHKHEAGDDPFRLLGRQDITAHVDFTALALAAQDANLRHLATGHQRQFLANLGIGGSVAMPSESAQMAEYFARRRAVEALLDPGGLGRIGALLFGKGVPAAFPTGFRD